MTEKSPLETLLLPDITAANCFKAELLLPPPTVAYELFELFAVPPDNTEY